jgi:hypothetical protein
MFDHFDNNSDGKISWAECWKVAEDYKPKAPVITESK